MNIKILSLCFIIMIASCGGGGASSEQTESPSKPNIPPIAVAGSDVTVEEKQTVQLNGSQSSDSDGSIATYLWVQLSGLDITFDDSASPTPSFLLPEVSSHQILNIELTVTDNKGATSSDTVMVTIENKEPQDSTPPEFDGIIGINSPSPQNIAIQWLPASDDFTPSENIKYEVHIAKASLPIPTQQTLALTIEDELQATISSLSPDETYNVLVIAKDNAGNKSQPTETNLITTLSEEVTTKLDIIHTDDIGLETPVFDGNNITFKGVPTQTIAKNEIISLVAQTGEIALKRVLDVSTTANETVIETEDISLDEVFLSGSIRSNFILKDFSSIEERDLKSQYSNSSSNKYNSRIVRNNSSKNKEHVITSNGFNSKKTISSYQLIKTVDDSDANCKKLPLDNVELNIEHIFCTDDGSYSLGIGLDFNPKITTDVDYDPINGLSNAEIVLNGHISFDAILNFEFSGAENVSGSKQIYIKKWRHLYQAGPIPIYQEFTLSLTANYSAEVKSDLSIAFPFSSTNDIKLGFLYNKETGWNDVKDVLPEYRQMDIILDVEGTLFSELSLIPKLEIKFYKLVTPSFDFSFKPYFYVDTTSSILTHSDLLEEEGYSTINFDKLDLGLNTEVNAFAEFSVFGKTLARYPETGNRLLYSFENQLLSLPDFNIELTSPPLDSREVNFTVNFEDGINNPFSFENTEWFIHPQASVTGSSVVPESGEKYVVIATSSGENSSNITQSKIYELDMRDNDYDGLPNAWESYFGLDPSNPSDALHDRDQDTINNLNEYTAGTDPTQYNFDFTKLDEDGNELSDSAANWDCIKDNITGLIWEVKTNDNQLRDYRNLYSWHNSDINQNGGVAGDKDKFENRCTILDSCNTESLILKVNEQQLCGADNWRLPTTAEALSIAMFEPLEGSFSRIDIDSFPNTHVDVPTYWTSTTVASSNGNHKSAFVFDYRHAIMWGLNKTLLNNVRLVRTAN